MKLNIPMSIAVLVFASNSSNASTTHTMTDGRFDFIDLEGVITDTGYNDVHGAIDIQNGTGSFYTTTPFSSITWQADVVEMDMHNTMMGGADTAVEEHTFGWTEYIYANSDFSDIQQCRVSNSGFNGCAYQQAWGMSQFGDGVYNEYTYNLASDQFAAGLFFDWSTNADIPVLAIWQIAAQYPDGSMDVVSIGDSCSNDGSLCGTAMITNPFPNQTPVFSGTFTAVSSVPVPAAVWLFGSGLIGLMGLARRKKL